MMRQKKNIESDYLIVFTDKNYNAIYAKTYNYIACKRKILVIPDDNSILGSLVLKYKLGETIKEKSELKKFILDKTEKKSKNKLNTKINSGTELDFFKRSHQAKIFSRLILELKPRFKT